MGEITLVKVGRTIMWILGALLALFAGFLSLFSLGGFVYAVAGRTHPPTSNVVSFLLGAVGFALVLWGFVRARLQKVSGGIMIIAGALLVAPAGVLAREPNIVEWLIGYVGSFLIAGLVVVFLGLRTKKKGDGIE